MSSDVPGYAVASWRRWVQIERMIY